MFKSIFSPNFSFFGGGGWGGGGLKIRGEYYIMKILWIYGNSKYPLFFSFPN